ncbi:MAG: hypothetical protein GXO26_01430 [Crenarchaeota archaeon]|nr:hypothetical protein [Thermoproteota archaeon]
MKLDKAIRKLQEAETVEERRVIIEELRDRRSRLWELYRMWTLSIVCVLSGQMFSGLCVAYSYVIHNNALVTIFIAVLQGLVIPLAVCSRGLLRTSRQIKDIDNILLDPPMLPLEEKDIIILLIIGITITIIRTIFGLAALGIIHL